MTDLRELLHAAVDDAAAATSPVADWLTPVRSGIRWRRRRRAVAAVSGVIMVSLLGVAAATALATRDNASVVAGVPYAVRTAERAVVRVTGTAPSCSRRARGTGFLFAPGRVMTNAHVVAGVTEDLQVATSDGRTARAVVVLFDPSRDVAVLEVDALDETPLALAASNAAAGDDVYTIGYPEDGDRRTSESRVSAVQRARGPDIYQSQTVTREIYQLEKATRPGEVGGPVLATDGRVIGMVFARAVDGPDASYALTATELKSAADEGAAAADPVSTSVCD